MIPFHNHRLYPCCWLTRFIKGLLSVLKESRYTECRADTPHPYDQRKHHTKRVLLSAGQEILTTYRAQNRKKPLPTRKHFLWLLGCMTIWSSKATLVAQIVKSLPAIRETWVLSLVKKIPGEGNGYPLQYCCLGNPMDREACWTLVHGVAKSRTQLID